MRFQRKALYNDFIQLLQKEAKGIEERVIEYRRHIHMHPETGYDTQNTEQYIREVLGELDIQIIPSQYGVLGLIPGKKEEIVALRADIDALCLTEESNTLYKSKIQGKMHACGHDGHAAMLLGAAELISKHREMLEMSVLLIFQPAEEGPGQGGAVKVIEELENKGILPKIKYIFGMHLSNEFPCGVLATRSGCITASTNGFEIKIIGKGGHAANPNTSIDALSIGAKLINNIESMMSRQIDPFCPSVFNIGVFKSGTAKNIIAETAIIEGTIRCDNSSGELAHIIDNFRRVLEGTCSAFGAEFELKISDGVVALITDAEATDFAVTTAKQYKSESHIMIPEHATMGAEDFAFYAQKIPAAFMYLGSRNEAKGYINDMHHPAFDFDESALKTGVMQHCMIAFSMA